MMFSKQVLTRKVIFAPLAQDLLIERPTIDRRLASKKWEPQGFRTACLLHCLRANARLRDRTCDVSTLVVRLLRSPERFFGRRLLRCPPREPKMFRRLGGSSSLWKSKNPHSLEYLKYLHGVMIKNEKVSEGNRTLLVEALRAIAEILIWGDQNDSTVFE
uniref:FPL domain-containing protein n=1 Tax=Steinernema glaseri TaxID=37863 RepID=A0A1I7YGK3_9BILA